MRKLLKFHLLAIRLKVGLRRQERRRAEAREAGGRKKVLAAVQADLRWPEKALATATRAGRIDQG